MAFVLFLFPFFHNFLSIASPIYLLYTIVVYKPTFVNTYHEMILKVLHMQYRHSTVFNEITHLLCNECNNGIKGKIIAITILGYFERIIETVLLCCSEFGIT